MVIYMANCNCDPLALTTAINSLAVAIACQLNDNELDMIAAIFNQLGDVLETISAQRAFCSPG